MSVVPVRRGKHAPVAVICSRKTCLAVDLIDVVAVVEDGTLPGTKRQGCRPRDGCSWRRRRAVGGGLAKFGFCSSLSSTTSSCPHGQSSTPQAAPAVLRRATESSISPRPLGFCSQRHESWSAPRTHALRHKPQPADALGTGRNSPGSSHRRNRSWIRALLGEHSVLFFGVDVSHSRTTVPTPARTSRPRICILQVQQYALGSICRHHRKANDGHDHRPPISLGQGSRCRRRIAQSRSSQRCCCGSLLRPLLIQRMGQCWRSHRPRRRPCHALRWIPDIGFLSTASSDSRGLQLRRYQWHRPDT